MMRMIYTRKIRMITAVLLLALMAGCGGDDDAKIADGDTDADFEYEMTDLLPFVDPLIGSAGSGNVIVGALRPHGFVRVGPATHEKAGAVAGYRYDNPLIDGFAHTFLEGPGGSGNGYAQVLIVPATGDISATRDGYAQGFDHADEQAEPGYYAVTLANGVRAEMTAGGFTAIHRYSYPASADAAIILDLGYSRSESVDGWVDIVDDHTIEGMGTYNVHYLLSLLLADEEGSTGISTVYLHIETSAAITESGVFHAEEDDPVEPGVSRAEGARIGAYARFGNLSQPLVLRVGLSRISVEQARLNLSSDPPSAEFDGLRADTAQRWNRLLNRIRVTGGSDEEKTVFYTGLYRSYFQPADLTEAGGEYFNGADGVGTVETAGDWRYFSDDWCLWDTFRTLHPLGTLVEPEIRSDIVRSMLAVYERGGWLPKCSWEATGYSRVMIANPATPVIVDAYVKGLDDFDVDEAYAAMRKSAVQDNDNPMQDAMCGYVNLGTPEEYMTLGYVSHECDQTQGASMTLEYAQDDFCLARMAEILGNNEDAAYFYQRSQNYRNHWNADEGFMVGRNRDGSWVTPFDPANTDDFNDFCEASSWVYSWYVPHDVPGLIELIGGDQATVDKLDAFFDGDYFDVSNEPSFHIPFLYNFAGRPDKTQQRVDRMWREAFSTAPDGLPGNDDSGAMSAYAVFAMVGLYPVSPGEPRYQISTPAFSRVALNLNPAWYAGGQFVIEARGLSETAIYIQSATLNGTALETTEITHDQIAAGGTLVLEMGDQPGDWGR